MPTEDWLAYDIPKYLGMKTYEQTNKKGVQEVARVMIELEVKENSRWNGLDIIQ